MDKNFVDKCWEKLDNKLSITAVSSYDKLPYTTINGVHDDKRKVIQAGGQTVSGRHL